MSSIFYMFFTSIAPALSFGSLLNETIKGELGVTEVLFTTSLCEIMFAILSGQPMVIVGVTGPVAIFAATLYSLSITLNIPFIPFLAATGFWAGLMHMILGITNASTLVKFITRFTNEIFENLIAVIFLVTAGKDIVRIFMDDSMDAALFTFLIAYDIHV